MGNPFGPKAAAPAPRLQPTSDTLSALSSIQRVDCGKRGSRLLKSKKESGGPHLNNTKGFSAITIWARVKIPFSRRTLQAQIH